MAHLAVVGTRNLWLALANTQPLLGDPWILFEADGKCSPNLTGLTRFWVGPHQGRAESGDFRLLFKVRV